MAKINAALASILSIASDAAHAAMDASDEKGSDLMLTGASIAEETAEIEAARVALRVEESAKRGAKRGATTVRNACEARLATRMGFDSASALRKARRNDPAAYLSALLDATDDATDDPRVNVASTGDAE